MGNEIKIGKENLSFDLSQIKEGVSISEFTFSPELLEIFKKYDKNETRILENSEISLFVNEVKQFSGDDFFNNKEIGKFIESDTNLKSANVNKDDVINFFKQLLPKNNKKNEYDKLVNEYSENPPERIFNDDINIGEINIDELMKTLPDDYPPDKFTINRTDENTIEIIEIASDKLVKKYIKHTDYSEIHEINENISKIIVINEDKIRYISTIDSKNNENITEFYNNGKISLQRIKNNKIEKELDYYDDKLRTLSINNIETNENILVKYCDGLPVFYQHDDLRISYDSKGNRTKVENKETDTNKFIEAVKSNNIKEIDNLLSQIEPKEIIDIIKIYEEKTGSSLISDIKTLDIADENEKKFASAKLRNMLIDGLKPEGKPIQNFDEYLKYVFDDDNFKVKNLNSENIIYVFILYSKKSGSHNILSDIQNSDLPENIKKEYIEHFISGIKDIAKDEQIYIDDILTEWQNDNFDFKNEEKTDANINAFLGRLTNSSKLDKASIVNGKIDGTADQGITGDCWLLSAIRTLAMDDKGLKFLNDGLTYDNDTGDISVLLRGANNGKGITYTITKEELDGSTNFSDGDLDIRAYEIAVFKYMKEFGLVGTDNSIDFNISGGYALYAFDLITGIKKSKVLINNDPDPINPDELPINFSASFYSDNANNCGIECLDIYGSKVNLFLNHSYTASFIKIPKIENGIKIEQEVVSLINPHDGSEEILLSKETFLKYLYKADTYDLSENEDKN